MNMENAWQYSKVHPEHVGGDIEPGDAYWSWAIAGWHNQRAVRYPMGKGAKPLYSWWNGQKLDYVAARRKIYIPLYARAVHEYAYPQFKRLQSIAVYSDLTIHDYDAYNHYKLNMSWSDVVNCTERKMGHGFVLALMLYELLNENYEFSF
jgi:hypothetical protein